MTSHTSTKTHFGMDERGLGGTHMIQQQFLTMHRKIREAQKQVDNNPPTGSMFRRPYYSQFSNEYWQRIKPPALKCKAKVDTSAPESYRLIAGLYINKKKRVPSAPSRRLQGGADGSPRDESPRVAPLLGAVDPRTRMIDVPRCNSLDEYAEYCNRRREAIASQMAKLQQKRLCGDGSSSAENDNGGASNAALAALTALLDQQEASTRKGAAIVLRPPSEAADECLKSDQEVLAPTPPPRTLGEVQRAVHATPRQVVDTPRRLLAVSELTPRKMVSLAAAHDNTRDTPVEPQHAAPRSSVIAGTRSRVATLIQKFVDDEDQTDDRL